MPTAWEYTEATRHDEDKSEARFTKPRPDCPHPERWTSQDIEATEDQVIDGIAGLVRMLQPGLVLETGSHRGFATRAIGDALAANGHGRLVSVEIDPRLHAEAVERCRGLECVEIRLGSSLELVLDETIDFAWFDSGPGTVRYEEFKRFFPQMTHRTIVGFHDVAPHMLRALVIRLTEEGCLVPVFLPTPRGVAICQVFPH